MPNKGTKRKKSKGRVSAHPEIEAVNANASSSSSTTQPANTQNEDDIVIISEEHKSAGQETLSFNRVLKVKRDYCNRITRMINCIEEHYFLHSKSVVIPITDEMRANPTRFFHKNLKDFEYHKLQYPVIEAFLGQAKLKADGNHYSFSQQRKYYDSLLFGAEQTGKYLSNNFANSMDKYYDCLKKEKSSAKQEGKLDVEDADPISQALYEQICRWAVRENSMFVWAYSVMMWNCMARSINIETLSLNNMKRGASESIQWTYDKSKADQKGEKVRKINLY